MNWMPLKEFNTSNLAELAEYAIANEIAEESTFEWWVTYTIRKRDRIIFKTKKKYWRMTQKFGVRLPKTVEEALQVGKINGSSLEEVAI